MSILGIVSAVVSVAASIVKGLSIAGMAIQGLQVVGNLLVGICKALGIVKEETQTEELGDKALQSDLKPDDFDSYEEYVKAVEKTKLDPEKSKLTTQDEKFRKGIELASGVVLEKFGNSRVLVEALISQAHLIPSKMIPELTKLLEAGNADLLGKYLNGTEKDEKKMESAMGMLADALKKSDSAVSDADALRMAWTMRKQG